jgi:hypothetical protein
MLGMDGRRRGSAGLRRRSPGRVWYGLAQMGSMAGSWPGRRVCSWAKLG